MVAGTRVAKKLRQLCSQPHQKILTFFVAGKIVVSGVPRLTLRIRYKSGIGSEDTRLDKPPPTFKRFSFHCHFTNSSPKSIMPSKPKTLTREYSDEMVGIILALREAGKSYAQIADQVKVS